MNKLDFLGKYLVALKKIAAVPLRLKRSLQLNRNQKRKIVKIGPRKVSRRRVVADVAVKVDP